MIIKAGTILTFEDGEFSDFSYNGPFRVLKDFDQKTVVNDYIRLFKPEYLQDKPDVERFLNYLSVNDYIVDDFPKYAWYLGAYKFEPQIADE
jgi:hypothetical protein